MRGTLELHPTWLTTKEAADLLRVHPKHVYRLLAQGLPGRRVGGQWRFVASELQGWARQNQRGARRRETEGSKLPQMGTSGGAQPCIIAGNGDLALDILAAELNRGPAPLVGLACNDAAVPFGWLESGAVTGAVVLGDLLSPCSLRLARIHLAHEVFGLAAPRGSPVPTLQQLTRKSLPIAGWAPGCDLRLLFDGVLAREQLDSRQVHASSAPLGTHADVVSAVLRGQAKVGVTTASWAARHGLAFTALGSRPLGLLVVAASLGQAPVVRLWEAVTTVAFREALERAGGYDAADAGQMSFLPSSEPRIPPSEKAAASAQDRRARWALLTRDRGADTSQSLADVVERLRANGVRVGGFLQEPTRSAQGVVGYDLVRVAKRGRVCVARRRGAPKGASSTYRSFEFAPAGFERARTWLSEDADHCDVLVIDGVSTLEARGEGHFQALVWAARLDGTKTIVSCIRRDQLQAIVHKLGIDSMRIALVEAPVSEQEKRRLVTAIRRSRRERAGAW